MDPAIIGGGLKLLGGLFGKKQKQMTPAQSIMSTAQGVTDAAAATGLNRLTLLSASNATAGAGMSMGGPPPLASLSVLGDIIDENFSDEAKERKEHNKLQNELLRLEVDKARSLSAVAPVASVASGGAITGGRGNTRVGSFVGAAHDFTQDNAGLTPGRGAVVDPQRHASGIIQYNNALTGPVSLLGDDGEPFMEYVQVPIVGGFQVMNNWAKHLAMEYVAPAISKLSGQPVNKARTKEYYLTLPAPFGRDAYGRPLPKPEIN